MPGQACTCSGLGSGHGLRELGPEASGLDQSHARVTRLQKDAKAFLSS